MNFRLLWRWVVLGGAISIRLQAYDQWQSFPQDISRSNLWSVAYVPERTTLVAVGEQGSILTYSYGNLTWESHDGGTDAWLVGVGVGAGRIVVVGAEGRILTSDDGGETWQPRVSGTTQRLNAAAYGGGRWLVVGESGTVLTSTDGTVWESRPSLGTGFLRGLAYGRGQFLLGGASGRLYATVDAVTFTPVPIATNSDIEGIAISTEHVWLVGSGSFRAVATQLGSWTIATNSVSTKVFRGVAVRNSDEASAVGDYGGDVWLGTTWGGMFSPPRLFATAVTQGLNEMVAVGFGGMVERTRMTTLPYVIFNPGGYVPYGKDVEVSVFSTDPILAYQWLRDGVDIPGATAPTFVVKFGTPTSQIPNAIRMTTASGVSTVYGGTFTARSIPGGRPEVIDPGFRSALPVLPTVLVPQTDGRLLVAGSFSVSPDGGSTYGLARLLPDGNLDRGFRAGAGIDATTSIDGILPLTNGRLYIRGSFGQIGGTPRIGLARLLSDGTVDPLFVPDGSWGFPVNFALDPTGRLLVQRGSGDRAALGRLQVDGSRDAGFTVKEKHELLGVDGQGRVLAIDLSASGAQMVRLLPDGAVDPSYQRTPLSNYPGQRRMMGTVVADSGVYALERLSLTALSQTEELVRYRPDGGRDLAYVPVPRYYLSSGSVSFVFSLQGRLTLNRLFSGVPMAETQFFDPGGLPDPTRYATLPNLAGYRLLAQGVDGSIYGYLRTEFSRDGPNLIRVVPKTGTSGRLTNLSVRAYVDPQAPPLIVGFVTSGTGSMLALVRASGPALVPFGVTDVLPNPNLELFLNSLRVESNNDWSAGLTASFAAAGAFAFPPLSVDAALLSVLGSGGYSALVQASPGTGAGTALAELYEYPEAMPSTRRLVNASTRGKVTADRPLIAGFSLQGEVPRTVLIRGAGPALALFGVNDILTDPRLTLYDSNGQALWSNDDWSAVLEERTTTGLASGKAGAFPFDPGSKDAGMVVTLPAGGYTAVLTGAGSSAGTALIEVYEVP
ncbi:MAG: hypothetical protein JNN01_06115 [Opitutaceae bacterium]|nr:hypothetical protein [Opitutaceae bacterium]